MINDFKKCFQYSLGAREKFDESVLLKLLWKSVNVKKTDKDTDKQGVDYIVTFKDGSIATIDSKTRMPGSSKFWKHGEPELCIERYSVVEEKIKGWLLKESDIHPDYILYTFDAKDTPNVYLIPFILLRNATFKHGKTWRDTYGLKVQRSEYKTEYHSDALFVPASIVIKAVSEEMMATAV